MLNNRKPLECLEALVTFNDIRTLKREGKRKRKRERINELLHQLTELELLHQNVRIPQRVKHH